MEVVYQRCCGIDVHKKMIVACFRDGRKKEIREFGTLTSELRELTSWLLDNIINFKTQFFTYLFVYMYYNHCICTILKFFIVYSLINSDQTL